jgi:hypothetical protein
MQARPCRLTFSSSDQAAPFLDGVDMAEFEKSEAVSISSVMVIYDREKQDITMQLLCKGNVSDSNDRVLW